PRTSSRPRSSTAERSPMHYAIFRTSDGALVSTGTVIADAETLTAKGLEAVELGDDWSPAGLVWDAEPRAFIETAAEPTVLTPRDCLRRLTVQARIAVRQAAKTAPVVADFLDLLDRAVTVSVAHPDTIARLGYLVSLELLTSERAA